MRGWKRGAWAGFGGRDRPRPKALLTFVPVAWWLLAAVPAWAAHVVDVRVGYHPGYARVVFELDSSAGYRVERHAPVPGVAELVITLDAVASAETLDAADKSIIERVEVLSEGERSVAHIRLARDGLMLKEMMLRGPDRIVLDIVAEEKPREAAGSTLKTKAAPEPVRSERAAREPEPPPPSRPPTPDPSETRSLAAAAEPERGPAAPGAERPSSASAGQASQLALAEPQAATPEVPPAPAASRPPPKPAAPPSARAPSPRARSRPPIKPAVVPPPLEESFFTGTVGMAVGAVVLLVVVVAGFAWWRRSSAPDEDAFADAGMDEESPFAGFDAEPGAVSEGAQAGSDDFAFGAGTGEDSDTVDLAAASGQGPAVSERPGRQGGSEMDQQVSEGASTVIMDSPPMAAAGASEGAGASGDVMRMLREFERRISSLETRLDEAVDARERLERQVAAQTEELRVQRAAIARTQRAVRNLSRPEEDAAPTEPALRDPTRPEGPRG